MKRAFAALLLCILSCTRAEPKRPHVLLITLDTFRADRLGAKTPQLARLASEGIRFDSAQSPVPLTFPAHATMLSGLLPLHHGVRNNGAGTFPNDKETLATLFANNGYRTGAFIGAFVLDRRFGLSRGFETYDDDIKRDPNADLSLEAERRASEVVDRAVAWLGTSDSRPAFTWVHLWDTHAPYAPPAPFEQSYDGEAAYVDAQLGRLLAAIDRTNTIVVIAGDHGEALGEHGELTHGLLLYQPTLHVPFVIAAPEIKPRVIAEPVSTVDLAPTIAALAGFTMPKSDGRDLAQLLRDNAAIPATDVYAETQYPLTFGWSELTALRRDNLKLIAGPTAELFDLARDPREETNILTNQRRAYRDLNAQLDALRATTIATSQTAVDEETKSKLASLGYITPAGATPNGPKPDPRTMAPLFLQFEKALAAKDAAAFEELVRRDPNNPVFRSTLARLQRERGSAKEAIALYRQAVALAPNDADAWYNLGVAAAECCDPNEAREALTTAARLDPQRAATHNALGLVHLRANELPHAAEAFERAAQLDPRDSRPWSNLGNVLRAMNRPSDATAAYRVAMRLSPDDVDAMNGLGVLLVQQQRPREALPYFDSALQKQPAFYEAQLNRGIALQEAGDRKAAMAQYRALLQQLPPGARYDAQRQAAKTLLRTEELQ